MGLEVNKMLALGGRRTVEALGRVIQLDLQDVIFPVPQPQGDRHHGAVWTPQQKETALKYAQVMLRWVI